jgi:hypothetical protein
MDLLDSSSEKIDKIITLKQIRLDYDRCYDLKIKFLSVVSKLKFNLFHKSDMPYKKSNSQKIVWNFYQIQESFRRCNTTKEIIKFEQRIIEDKDDIIRILNK